MKLVPVKSSPMSSRWNFRGERDGLKFWSNRNGKTYAQDSQGNWFRVVRETSR